MRHVHLTFYERISVWNLIGNHQVPRLKEAAILLRIIEKVRPTDVELTEAQFMASGNQMSWQIPAAGYGDRTVAFEAEEAAALIQVLEAIQDVRVADAAWMCRLIHSLAAKENDNGRIESEHAQQIAG